MSDMPGLALALVAQALFLRGATDKRALVDRCAHRRPCRRRSRADRLSDAAAVRAGAVSSSGARACWWIATRPVAALAVGGLAWAIPLHRPVGWRRRTISPRWARRRVRTSRGRACCGRRRRHAGCCSRCGRRSCCPGIRVPLGIVVGVLALIGAADRRSLRHRRAVLLLALAFGPYAIFHLLFQETDSRQVCHAHAAGDGVARRLCGIDRLVERRRSVSGAIVAAALWFAVPVGIAYGREAHPAFRAIAANGREPHASTTVPSAFAHFSMLRPLAGRRRRPARRCPVEPRRSREWLGPVDYWRGGGRGPVWFLADPKRTDLALIDPQSRRDVTPLSVERRATIPS